MKEQRMTVDLRTHSAAQSSRKVAVASGIGSRVTSFIGSRIDSLTVAGKVGAVIAFLTSTMWGAYTYHNQQKEQKLQNFLQAYSTIHDDLGKSIMDSLVVAIKPIYSSGDRAFSDARNSANIAITEAAKKEATDAMQHWILGNILVKGMDP